MTRPVDGREIILDILIEILEKGSYSHMVLRQALNKYQYMEKSDRAFISRTVEGTIEYLLQIDYVLNEYSSTRVNKMKPVIRNLLRMSVYQILYLDRIPDSAVCNEAVKLAQKRKFTGLKGFVNGVLRNISRNKASITFSNPVIQYSMPEWILNLWTSQYGWETTEGMLKAFLEKSKTMVRCNTDKQTKQTILHSLKSQKVETEESDYSDQMIYIDKYDHIEALEAFQKGWIQVQDMSSSFVGQIASPKQGSYIIDVCGAPGGKSLHLADLLQGTGMVDVRDLTEEKVSMIEENISRSRFTNMKASVWDGRVLDPDSVNRADIVIADLPCSGLGIIGRKPDIKYGVTPEKIESLVALQREILTIIQEYVKPGGLLLYSTCTISQKENEENVNWFLEKFPFSTINIEGKLGEKIKSDSMKSGWIQLLPGIHPCDGFFIAAFTRNK